MTCRILATALTALLVAPGAPAVAAEEAPPNVLFIVLDDQNAFAGRTDLAPEPVLVTERPMRPVRLPSPRVWCVAETCALI